MLSFRCHSCQTLLADKQIPWENAIGKEKNDYNDKIYNVKKKYDQKKKDKDDFDYDKIDLEEVKELQLLQKNHEDNVQKILDELFVVRLCCRMRVITYIDAVGLIK